LLQDASVSERVFLQLLADVSNEISRVLQLVRCHTEAKLFWQQIKNASTTHFI